MDGRMDGPRDTPSRDAITHLKTDCFIYSASKRVHANAILMKYACPLAQTGGDADSAGQSGPIIASRFLPDLGGRLALERASFKHASKHK